MKCQGLIDDLHSKVTKMHVTHISLHNTHNKEYHFHASLSELHSFLSASYNSLSSMWRLNILYTGTVWSTSIFVDFYCLLVMTRIRYLMNLFLDISMPLQLKMPMLTSVFVIRYSM